MVLKVIGFDLISVQFHPLGLFDFHRRRETLGNTPLCTCQDVLAAVTISLG